MAKAPRKRSSLESKLQTALHVASAAKEELAAAEAKLKPLRRLTARAVKNAAKLVAKYSSMAGFGTAPKTRRGGKRGKRSPEVRARMAASQRKRWAAKKKAEAKG